MKLIDKDALVAWAKETYLCENASMIRKVCYKQLLEHLDTLEVKEISNEYDGFLGKELKMVDDEIERLEKLKVKEVDLDLEITLWANAIPEIRLNDVERLAKYFFELGLKAQKGENAHDSR